MRPTLLYFAALATIGPAFAADTSGGLPRLLSNEEFSRAGLNKLTPEELIALETALQAHGLMAKPATRPVVASPARPLQSAELGDEQVVQSKPRSADAAANELHAHIVGSLDGYSGRALFTLDNGQVWQQRIPDSASFVRKLVNPEVVITQGFGGYKMLIVPADRVVFVKRIR